MQQRHFTSFLGRRFDARDPIGEFESRFGRWTRFECKPTRDRSLSFSLSLSLCCWQPEEWREGWEDVPDAPDGAFRSEPPGVYIRPQNSSRHAALLPLYPRELARLRNFRFGLIQFSKSFDFLPDVPDFWYGVFCQQRGWKFSLFLSME